MIRALLMLSLVALAGCAELRAGWVKVDFLEGRVPAQGACVFKVNADGMIEAVCTAINEVSRDAAVKHKAPNTAGQL